MSSLQIRYDQSGNGCGENLPPVAASIEQLLERQWSEGQQFLLEQGTPSDSKYSQSVYYDFCQLLLRTAILCLSKNFLLKFVFCCELKYNCGYMQHMASVDCRRLLHNYLCFYR